SGDLAGCYEIYAATARMMIKTFDGGLPVKKCLQKALDQCLQLDDPDKKAWTMRHAFDAILAGNVEEARGAEDIALERVGGIDPGDLDLKLEKALEEKPVKT